MTNALLKGMEIYNHVLQRANIMSRKNFLNADCHDINKLDYASSLYFPPNSMRNSVIRIPRTIVSTKSENEANHLARPLGSNKDLQGIQGFLREVVIICIFSAISARFMSGFLVQHGTHG